MKISRLILILSLIPLLLVVGFSQDGFQLLRAKMIEEQLISRGINDSATLAAMAKVPRHLFVPDVQKLYAYSDGALPIGKGQTISQPFIVAFMTQSLQLKKDSKILEIGTGSGYQAAILGEITARVYSVEIVPSLGLEARDLLQELDYANIEIKIGDGYNGWEENAPFDAIIVTAGAEKIPKPLIEQLALGGRMIIPLGPHHGIRHLIQIDKTASGIKKKSLMAVRFVPLTRQTTN